MSCARHSFCRATALSLASILALPAAAMSAPAAHAPRPEPGHPPGARAATLLGPRPAPEQSSPTLPPGRAVSRSAPRRDPPVAFAFLVNPVETGASVLLNKLLLISPLLLLGDGRGACVLSPQGYALTRERVGGAGALVGFRIFSGRAFDGLYFGVRFGGGVGNHSFKAFMGEVDAGYGWAIGPLRLGIGLSAGGGYMAYGDRRGSLYLFSLDLSIGFAVGRFNVEPPAR